MTPRVPPRSEFRCDGELPRTDRRRCRHSARLGAGGRQGRQGTPCPGRCRRHRHEIQTYLLAERPDIDADGAVTDRLFVVAKGRNRGRALTAEGLRAVFRYHRTRSGVTGGHPHALRHSFGTALAQAGVDLAVIATLLVLQRRLCESVLVDLVCGVGSGCGRVGFVDVADCG